MEHNTRQKHSLNTATTSKEASIVDADHSSAQPASTPTQINSNKRPHKDISQTLPTQDITSIGLNQYDDNTGHVVKKPRVNAQAQQTPQLTPVTLIPPSTAKSFTEPTAVIASTTSTTQSATPAVLATTGNIISARAEDNDDDDISGELPYDH